MTTVFREIPSNFWLLLFYTDENTRVQNLFETTGQTFPDTMPPSLCKPLGILICSQNAQYVSRQHQENDVNFGHLDGICQTLPSNHHHTLLFIPACVDAEKILKQTIMQVLSTAQNAHVKLMTVSYPENFLRSETNKLNTSAISVRGEKMQSLLKKKTTDGIGCNFKCRWEYEKQNPLGTSGDTEKALFLFQRLVELEKSDAPFKDTVISFIELLQKGIGRLYLSEHSRTLDIDLGVSNAQCTCFECFSQPLHLIGSTTQEANNYSPQLFSAYDEDTIIDTSFL